MVAPGLALQNASIISEKYHIQSINLDVYHSSANKLAGSQAARIYA